MDKKEKLKKIINKILTEENLTPMDLITMKPDELKNKINQAVRLNKPIVDKAFQDLRSNSTTI